MNKETQEKYIEMLDTERMSYQLRLLIESSINVVEVYKDMHFK